MAEVSKETLKKEIAGNYEIVFFFPVMLFGSPLSPFSVVFRTRAGPLRFSRPAGVPARISCPSSAPGVRAYFQNAATARRPPDTEARAFPTAKVGLGSPLMAAGFLISHVRLVFVSVGQRALVPRSPALVRPPSGWVLFRRRFPRSGCRGSACGGYGKWRPTRPRASARWRAAAAGRGVNKSGVRKKKKNPRPPSFPLCFSTT